VPGAYTFFDHTADAGLNIRGDSCEEVFEYAALGMCSLIVDPDTVERKQEIEINISSYSLEELFFQWLKEVLYQINSTGMVFSSLRLKIDEFSGIKGKMYYISAFLYGEKLDIERHEVCNEIKAVTRHILRLKGEKKDWKATVIFDL